MRVKKQQIFFGVLTNKKTLINPFVFSSNSTPFTFDKQTETIKDLMIVYFPVKTHKSKQHGLISFQRKTKKTKNNFERQWKKIRDEWQEKNYKKFELRDTKMT